MAFTGVLKTLNTNNFTAAAARAGFLAANAEDLGPALTAQNIDELAVWLMVEVSSSAEACNATADDLYAFVNNITTDLVNLAQAGVASSDSVADFLTEMLRVYNFAKHSKTGIAGFIGIMRLCGIVIVGNPDTCKEMATFKELGYSKVTHQVTMRAA